MWNWSMHVGFTYRWNLLWENRVRSLCPPTLFDIPEASHAGPNFRPRSYQGMLLGFKCVCTILQFAGNPCHRFQQLGQRFVVYFYLLHNRECMFWKVHFSSCRCSRCWEMAYLILMVSKNHHMNLVMEGLRASEGEMWKFVNPP